MKPISGKEFCKVLERNGWSLLRIQGSHSIYGKLASDVRLSVPVHKNKVLKTGLFNHLARLAELTEKDLK